MGGRYRAYAEYKDSGVEWLGEIPTGWNAIRLKHVADLEGRKIDSALGLNYVGMENVQSGNGRYIETEEVFPEGVSSSFSEGNVLFGKLRPYLAKSWLATFSGICSSEFLVFNSRIVNRKFLLYYTLCDEFVKQVDSSTYGSKMPRASWDFIGLMMVPAPSENESERIAKFLDHETAKIDTLIEKQQQLIKLLKEKRQAVISHAVTKGLNPNVPMKDSGVEWLGEVPEHWNVSRLKHLALRGVAGPYGSSLTKGMYVSSGIRVYGQQQVIANDFTVGDYYISDEKFAEMNRYEVFAGDLLVTVMGTIGKVAVVPVGVERGIINPRLVRYELDTKKIEPEFAQKFMMGEIVQLRLGLVAQGTTMDGLNMQILGEIPIAFPDVAEQNRILNAVKERSGKYDFLINNSEKAVSLLQERRTALISAAVTGKIDVRDWQPPATTPDL